MTFRRRILMESSQLSSPLSANLNFSGGIASFSSKFSHYFGRGLEKHVEKLEEETGDFNKILVTRTIKLRVPCKDRNLYAHKHQFGLWKPRVESVKHDHALSFIDY